MASGGMFFFLFRKNIAILSEHYITLGYCWHLLDMSQAEPFEFEFVEDEELDATCADGSGTEPSLP